MISVNNQHSNGDSSPNIIGSNNYVVIGTEKKACNEVKTIQLIIHTLTKLSKDNESENYESDRNIDPEHKILNRFAKYADQLMDLYTDLSIRYGEFYELVLKDNQIPRTDVDLVTSYLRRISFSILEKNNQNPILALQELTKYLEDNFNDLDISGFEYDDGAVSFYLYKELIRCNVFPNPIK